MLKKDRMPRLLRLRELQTGGKTPEEIAKVLKVSEKTVLAELKALGYKPNVTIERKPHCWANTKSKEEN